jgi:autotransporter-associated beta strand protein
LLLAGSVDNNGRDLTLHSLGAINFSGPLLGSGGLIKTGSGFLQFGVSNSYAGPTEIREGNVQLLNGYGLGSSVAGTMVLPAARLSLQPGLTVAEPLTLSGTLAMDAGSATCSGPINLPANSNGHIDVGGGLLTLTAMVSGDGGFSKTGAGTLALTFNNTYLGPTDVQAGALQVLGVQPGTAVNIHPGALLAGTGTVGALSCAGTLSPGVNGPGILRITAGALFTSPSTCQVELNGPVAGDQYDQVKVNGEVQVQNASLRVTAGYTPALGTSFTIVDNDGSDPVVGTFNGLPEGAIFGANSIALQISYIGGSGNDVVLKRVALPRPSILSINLDASRHVTLQAKGISQFDYTFEASSNLVAWASIGASHSNDNGDFSFIEPAPQNVTQRFYRVRAP